MTRDLPDFDTLRLEPVDDDLCWLVLDRPRTLNAMSVGMRREMPVALAAIADRPWRVLLLRGEGRAFSSGADLRDFLANVDVTDLAAVRAAVEGWHTVVRMLRALPQATVAAVHGPVYGGGANLALAADVVVAGHSTRMVQSYVDIGASVDLGGSWVLPRLAGLARGRRLLMTGEALDADECVAAGLVSEAVPDGELRNRVEALGRVLAAKDPGVLRTIRRTIDQGLSTSLDEHLDTEADAVAALVGRSAFADGTRRFAD
jgi:2-(1,2-epoxy-1,2-dihydrophenyl)acetyl-CoA isomerase